MGRPGRALAASTRVHAHRHLSRGAPPRGNRPSACRCAEFGIGLASAVFLDAFILRTILVPAVMHLFGQAKWWLPRWIDGWLPHLAVEPADDAVTAPATEPLSAGAAR